jgi:hypothetical protein
LKLRVKAPFGEVIVEGESAKDVLDILHDISPEFLRDVEELVSSRLSLRPHTQLQGIIEFTTEGPVLTARGKFTHYEAIALLLYSCEKSLASAALLDRLLQSSGVRAMVPARLNEMTKRGLVFKPDPKRPEYKLTVQGEKWVEEKALPKFQKQLV